MEYHKLLQRQIDRFFPDEDSISPSLKEFLQLVSRTYQTFEKDKWLSEHAFNISEREYQDVLKNMRTQSERQNQSIAKLKEVINSLDPNASIPELHSDDELRSVVAYLEKQIAKSKALESDIINARDQAEKASKAKGDFLSVMSHEIRTPLNAIIGIAHLMMHEPLPPNQVENLRTLNLSAENLLNLINDILDYSRIEEGRLELSPKKVNLRELVNNIRLSHRVRSQEAGNSLMVTFDPWLPQTVWADEVRLGQILNNLVSNAVKFTTNGTIRIELVIERSTAQEVDIRFNITDTGIGIEPEKQSVIFEHFSQADSEITRKYGGSGLGLTIVKRLLRLMHSDIHLESAPGRGSRFYFTLRLKTEKDETSQRSSGPATQIKDLEGIKILLVEDVEFNVMVAKKMLSNWKAVVDVAENGAIAVDLVRQQEYDLILMDLQMPVMDGYTATKHIREFNQQVPIIALTAFASSDVENMSMDVGMNAFLSKPFKPTDLYEIIRDKTMKVSDT